MQTKRTHIPPTTLNDESLHQNYSTDHRDSRGTESLVDLLQSQGRNDDLVQLAVFFRQHTERNATEFHRVLGEKIFR